MNEEIKNILNVTELSFLHLSLFYLSKISTSIINTNLKYLVYLRNINF